MNNDEDPPPNENSVQDDTNRQLLDPERVFMPLKRVVDKPSRNKVDPSAIFQNSLIPPGDMNNGLEKTRLVPASSPSVKSSGFDVIMKNLQNSLKKEIDDTD